MSAIQLLLETIDPGIAYTETGNAQLFAKRYEKSFSYLADTSQWLAWDGRRWRRVDDTFMCGVGMPFAADLFATAAKQNNPEGLNWAKQSASRKIITSTISLAKPLMAAKTDDFDRALDHLNVLNGTIDLRTGALLPHNPADKLTSLTEIIYDPNAKCPRWEQFISEIFEKHPDIIPWIQRAIGYTLTGQTKAQVFFILIGDGENGKGVFVNVLLALLGDAGRTTSIRTFAVKKNESDNTPALARLAGLRCVATDEANVHVRFDEAQIKMLTGETSIEVCAKYKDPFNYTPRFKLWFAVNHAPTILATDHGIWRRPKQIPFASTFLDGRRDRDLQSKLYAELPGILAWAVRGAMAWYRDGLGSCPSVDAATRQYREESDHVTDFVADTFDPAPGERMKHEDYFRLYKAWWEARFADNRGMLTQPELKKRLVGRVLPISEGKSVTVEEYRTNLSRGISGVRERPRSIGRDTTAEIASAVRESNSATAAATTTNHAQQIAVARIAVADTPPRPPTPPEIPPVPEVIPSIPPIPPSPPPLPPSPPALSN